MSGHITRMSRGSSVWSSASRPSRTSRSTSIWRAGPWQLCTWTERSSLRSVRPSGRTALAVMSDCSQPSSVSGCVTATEVFVGVRVGGQAALELAQVAAEGGQQRVSDVAMAGVVAAGDQRRARPRASATGRRWGAAATGGDRGVWPGHRAARPRWPAVGCARTGTGVPAGRSVTPAAAQVFWRAGREAGRRRRGPTAPATAAAASRGRNRYHRRHHVPSRPIAAAAGGRRTRTTPRADARRRSGGLGAAPSPRPLRSGRDAPRACRTTARRGCSRSPRAVARPWRRATTDRRQPCR